MSNSLAKVHPELVSEWSERNFPLTPDNITYGSNKRVWWKGSCGHEWQASVKARSKGEGCPICSGARVVEGINDLATVKPKLSLEWSEKNTIKPTEVTAGSHKKVIWKCEHGHEWTATVKSRTINKTGCPYCSHNKVLAGFNDLASQYPDIAAEWSDRNLPLLPTMVTAFANSKAWWKCRDCGNEWYALISTRAGGSRCPYCSGYTFVEREAAAYDEKAVMENKQRKMREQGMALPCGCPGSQSRNIQRQDAPTVETPQAQQASRLSQWPVQIKLVPVNAPYFDGARLLIAADCTAYAYAAFHERFIKGHITLVGCPKLDSVDYAEKLTEIIRSNDIRSVTVVRMEVPCCGGLELAAKKALQQSGKFIPWQVVTVTVDGQLVEE